MMQQWFKDAKLGIFIHWGIYSVFGVGESWSFHNKQLTHEEYMKQCQGFTARNYNPKAWAELLKKVGARYAVLTTKHHDGVALWDTKQNDLSVVKKTPAGRDLIKPWVDAIREQGIKVGLYYSHLDWSHPDYGNMYNDSEGIGEDNIGAEERFIKFHRNQIQEILTNYHPVDLLWFDGDWEKSDEYWKMSELREFIHSINPNVILNSRMRGYGDYQTPEQTFPTVRPEGPWEFCVTMNDSWGFQYKDKNYKSVRDLIRIFVDCISMGGNLLLDIGPKEDGSLDPEQEKRLVGLGEWVQKYQEAIFETEEGLSHKYYYGPSTCSKDKKTIYLFCLDKPNGEIALKGLRISKIKRISALGTGIDLWGKEICVVPWSENPGILIIDVPEEALDKECTVIKIELKEELDLSK